MLPVPSISFRSEVDVVNYKNDWKRIAEIIFHPDYDKKTLYNDLALIRLQTDNRWLSEGRDLRNLFDFTSSSFLPDSQTEIDTTGSRFPALPPSTKIKGTSFRSASVRTTWTTTAPSETTTRTERNDTWRRGCHCSSRPIVPSFTRLMASWRRDSTRRSFAPGHGTGSFRGRANPGTGTRSWGRSGRPMTPIHFRRTCWALGRTHRTVALGGRWWRPGWQRSASGWTRSSTGRLTSTTCGRWVVWLR